MHQRPISGTEGAAYLTELAAMLAYVLTLHQLGPREHPDHTWKLVMLGVIISSAPAIALARLDPGDWRRYERRTVAGFLLSAAVVIPWQLLLTAERRGELREHSRSTHDKASTLE